MIKLIVISLTILFISLPFGYWRAAVPTKSKQWFLAIHLPVPVVVLIRIYSDIGFAFETYLFTVGGFFFGQLLGGKIYNWVKKKSDFTASSCIVMDFCRLAGACKAH